MIRRSVIDYSLQRRALLQRLYAGRAGTAEACDAQPHLLQAARYHGDRSDRPCPVCRREPLVDVHFVYAQGPKPGQLAAGSGQAKSAREIESMAGRLKEFTVYAVEVCRGCSWNHLTTSFVTGTDVAAPPERRATDRRSTAAE